MKVTIFAEVFHTYVRRRGKNGREEKRDTRIFEGMREMTGTEIKHNAGH